MKRIDCYIGQSYPHNKYGQRLAFCRYRWQATKRGLWSENGNPTFGRCKKCGGFQIKGICQKCGFAVQCAWCGDVKTSSGAFISFNGLPQDSVCHTICPSCKRFVERTLGLKRKEVANVV